MQGSADSWSNTYADALIDRFAVVALHTLPFIWQRGTHVATC
jgi:hypothetical protein